MESVGLLGSPHPAEISFVVISISQWLTRSLLLDFLWSQ